MLPGADGGYRLRRSICELRARGSQPFGLSSPCLLHRLFVLFRIVSSRKKRLGGRERAKGSERELVASDERERRVRW